MIALLCAAPLAATDGLGAQANPDSAAADCSVFAPVDRAPLARYFTADNRLTSDLSVESIQNVPGQGPGDWFESSSFLIVGADGSWSYRDGGTGQLSVEDLRYLAAAFACYEWHRLAAAHGDLDRGDGNGTAVIFGGHRVHLDELERRQRDRLYMILRRLQEVMSGHRDPGPP